MGKARATGRLRERRLAGSRREILEVTRTVLGRVGALRLTLELVAGELGITKQALYHYFPSRNELLLELAVDEQLALAHAVNRACAAAPDGAGALEALIRTYVGHFLPRLEMHRLIVMQTVPRDRALTLAEVERFRPINDLLYGEVERRLAAEQTGRRRDRRQPRRLAFTAHLAALGFITLRSIAAEANDPFVHSDDEVLDELCRTFRAAAENARDG